MAKTTVKQKLFLIVLGFFLSLVILEIILRMGGFVFDFFQERQNKINLTESEIRILCIGESTTALGGAASYPAQLEEILNDSGYDKKFKVINAGRVSKTTKDVLEELPQLLDKYKPHVIVSMLGVNDRKTYSDGRCVLLKVESFFENFRVYQFFELLGRHIHAKLNSDIESKELGEEVNRVDKFAQAVRMLVEGEVMVKRLKARLHREITPEKEKKVYDILMRLLKRQSWILLEMSREARFKGEYDNAIQFLESSIGYDPSNYGAYVEIGRNYKDQKKCDQALPFLKKAVAMDPESVLAKIELAGCYEQLGDEQNAAIIYEKVLEHDEKDILLFDSDVAQWFAEHGSGDRAEEVIREALLRDPGDAQLHKKTSQFYQREGDVARAQKHQKRAELLQKEKSAYLPVTIRYYNEIVDVISLKSLPLICMQYPMRDIESLKDIFWLDYPIIFVENKTNFEEGLKEGDYFEFFSDSFAEDFGHCTYRGNNLIAKNLAEVILFEIFEKKDDGGRKQIAIDATKL